ncbi:MAG: hypothetical protein ACRC6M_03290 [Microcystaceae cyanobacterium]
MQNLTAIPIIPEINDFPDILEDGPNGALITQKVNQLVQKSFRPFNTLDDDSAPIKRYVDTIAGSDDNDGLTATTAFKTIDKALDFYRTGMISWNWNCFIYVKGELQAPIDLRGLYATANDWFTEGTLTINKFPDETDNYTITSVSDSGDYLSKQVFIVDGNFISLYLLNCTLNITSQMVFIDNTIYFGVVKIKPTSTARYDAVIIGRGNYYLQRITHDYTDKLYSIQVVGVGCYLRVNNLQTFVNDQLNNTFLRIRGGAEGKIEATLTTSLNKNIVIENSKVVANVNVPYLLYEADGASDFSWNDWTKFNLCTTLPFATLPNGRYKVWTPQRKCRLLEWKLSASGGNGTFQADIGNADTLKIGAALTQTFTPAYEEITRSMFLDIPYAGAFPVFLSVTNSTVPLTNVLLQLNYRNY